MDTVGTPPSTSKRRSNLPPPGRFSFNNTDRPAATPRTNRKSKPSLLPSPHASLHKTNHIKSLSPASKSPPKIDTESPSTPSRSRRILQAISPSNKLLKKVPRTPTRQEAKLPSPSPGCVTPRKLNLPQISSSPRNSDDQTLKVDNSSVHPLTKQNQQRCLLPRANSHASNKRIPKNPDGKMVRKSSSYARKNSSTQSLLALSLSASSSRESNADNEEAVKVCVRIRPVFDISWEHRAWITGPQGDNTILRTGPDNTDSNIYRFDNVYGEKATTEQVYETMVQDIVSSVCRQGRNGTVFTYGQTSTGKTYTMHGIISAAARDIFKFSEDSKNRGGDGNSLLTSVKISCMELYNEELRDLLDTERGNSSGLGIKEDRKGNVQVPGLSERVVGSVEELLAILLEADTNRTVGSTAMNERSSRSHTIFRITYEKKESKDIGKGRDKKKKSRSFETTDVGDDGVECTLSGFNDSEDKENDGKQKTSKKMVTTVSTLNLVDLAGSESVRHTGATGDRQKEGGKINQSLLTLSTVLVKLGKKDPGHINYRDSKLTRILKPSLSGNARMSAICCITPMVQFLEESKSTLDFASRTMLVTTNAAKNETVEYDDAVVGEFEKEIERLRTETANAEKGQQQLAVSLQESAEQIVCLMANIELEKSKVSSLEKQNYEFMMQVEELTLVNEELKAAEHKQVSCDTALVKSIEELKIHNENLERKIAQLVEEKSQLEFSLMREVHKAEKRKDAAAEKRKRFKSKLGDMKARLKDDIAGGAPNPVE